MLKYVNCRYRVSLNGEHLHGLFDIEKGQICGMESLFTVDMSKHVYFDENYKDGVSMNDARLERYFLRQGAAVAVIDDCKVGVIVVTKTNSFEVYGDIYDLTLTPEVPLLKPYMRKTKTIGVIKTVVHDLSLKTPQEFLVVDETEDVPVVHTRYGVKKIPFQYDDVRSVADIDMSRHIELCHTKDAYASCSINGKPELLRIVGDYLEVM